MQVAECVHVEDVDKARGQKEVLEERREHVQRVALVVEWLSQAANCNKG